MTRHLQVPAAAVAHGRSKSLEGPPDPPALPRAAPPAENACCAEWRRRYMGAIEQLKHQSEHVVHINHQLKTERNKYIDLVHATKLAIDNLTAQIESDQQEVEAELRGKDTQIRWLQMQLDQTRAQLSRHLVSTPEDEPDGGRGPGRSRGPVLFEDIAQELAESIVVEVTSLATTPENGTKSTEIGVTFNDDIQIRKISCDPVSAGGQFRPLDLESLAEQVSEGCVMAAYVELCGRDQLYSGSTSPPVESDESESEPEFSTEIQLPSGTPRVQYISSARLEAKENYESDSEDTEDTDDTESPEIIHSPQDNVFFGHGFEGNVKTYRYGSTAKEFTISIHSAMEEEETKLRDDQEAHRTKWEVPLTPTMHSDVYTESSSSESDSHDSVAKRGNFHLSADAPTGRKSSLMRRSPKYVKESSTRRRRQEQVPDPTGSDRSKRASYTLQVTTPTDETHPELRSRSHSLFTSSESLHEHQGIVKKLWNKLGIGKNTESP